MSVIISAQPGPQSKLLSTGADVAFFGGASGGGKTSSLLLDFLRYYHKKIYGIFFRRTMPMIENPGSSWDTCLDLYEKIPKEIKIQRREIIFPKEAKLKFTHMESESDRFNHQGGQYGVVYFDELTHFTRTQFMYLISRLRSVSGVMPYVRATLNPDPDHFAKTDFIEWYLKDGFADPEKCGRLRYFLNIEDTLQWGDTREDLALRFPKLAKHIQSFTFINSRLEDNKIMTDKDPGYEGRLMALNKVDRERLRNGNWNIRPKAGLYFPSTMVKIIEAAPASGKMVRYWDRAATEKKQGNDPDWTVGLKLQVTDQGKYTVIDVKRFRGGPLEVFNTIQNVASQDGVAVPVWLEQEPGSSGVADTDNLIRGLRGFNARAHRPTGDKVTRAGPASAQWESGNVSILKGKWNQEFINELEAFPEGGHDDQVDALSGAFEKLSSVTLPGIYGVADAYELDYGDDD